MSSVSCVILLIEDDPDDVFLFKRAVAGSTLACEVYDVATLQDAEDYLTGTGHYADRKKHVLPDIIVTDLAFRGGSGFEFLSWLGDHAQLAGIPVICLSGTEDPAKLDRARAFGVKCLPKTGTFENALSVIEETLSHSRQKEAGPSRH
jgi:CheY-like chemotaxis protein